MKERPEWYQNPRKMGFCYTDTFSDKVAKAMYDALPPSNPDEKLPLYWSYTSPEEFTRKYGYLDRVVWSRRGSYHLLLINGQQVLRIWTQATYPRVELSIPLYASLTHKIVGLTSKPSTFFSGHVSVRSMEEGLLIMSEINHVYGLKA